jgi:hypothetical protein
MRRRWGLASFLAVSFVSVTAFAQPADEPEPSDDSAGATAPAQAIAYGAMPGGLHAQTAETLPKGAVQVSTLTGLGRRTGLLGPDHKFNRAIGDLAVAFGATANISVGLSLDGRYDRHWGDAPRDMATNMPAPNWGVSGDDGYVGDPKLIVRAGTSTGSVAFGGQIGVWVPGKDAPSVAASAISVDARAIVSLPAGPGLLSFSGGFRLDNSVQSIDHPENLSLKDRVSLGVSDYHAIMGAAQLRLPVGDKLWVAAEGSIDAFIGGPPTPSATSMEVKRAELPRSKLLFRGGLIAGFHINDSFSALVFVEAAKVPGINVSQTLSGNIPLIPYEPIVTGGLGIEARFGGPKKVKPMFEEKDCRKHNPPDCPAVKVPVLADISGTVTDSGGKPLAGAKVSLTLKNSQVAPTATDGTGKYTFTGVRIGDTVDGQETIDETGVEVGVELDGMKPGTATIAQVAKGTNDVPAIALDPVLPPGELRGNVRSLPGGKAVTNATITIEPGGKTIQTDADGYFSLPLAPGQYKIKVTAPKLQPQELDVTIENNSVAIKNIDLHR